MARLSRVLLLAAAGLSVVGVASASAQSADRSLTAGVPADQQAPTPARLPDGRPNWVGFWTPIGGMMDRNFGAGSTATPPAPPRPAPTAAPAAGAAPSETAGSPPSLLRSPYKEKYQQGRRDAAAGKVTFDPTALCLPPGMPRMMRMIYGMEVMQAPGQITISGEWQSAQRRIWLDGRKHPNAEEELPTYAGHSVGRWEGDVLVVETVQVRSDVLIDQAGLPITEKAKITEKIWSPAPGVLIDEVTIDDPDVYTAPWKLTWRYRYRTDQQLKEYICQENNRNVGANGEPQFEN